MLLASLARYLLTAAAILVTLTLLGAPLKLLANRLAGVRVPVPAPTLGMAVAAVVGWYWYGTFGGLRTMTIVLCVVGAGVLVAVAVVQWPNRRNLVAAFAKRSLPAAAVGAGVAIVFSITLGGVLSLDHMTAGARGNNDIVNYAVVAQHLRDASPDDAGPVEGGDLGERARSPLDFGSVAVLAVSSSLGPFDDVWRYLFPMIAVASGLCAYTLFLLLDQVVPGRSLLVGVICVASISPFLFAYLWSEYFLNQILAIGFVFAICTLLMASAAALRRAAAIVPAVAAGGPLAVLAVSYPHMAVIGPAVVLPAAMAAAGGANLVRRVARVLLAGVVGVLVVILLLPGVSTEVPGNIRGLGGVAAGWSLPGFLPLDVLGFLATPRPHHVPEDWIPSVVLLVAVVAAAGWLVLSRGAPAVGRFSLVAVATTLLSYWLAYATQGGTSYRQWKWITFFVPFFAAAVLLALLVALDVALRHFEPLGRQLAIGVAVAFTALTVASAGSTVFLPGSETIATLLRPDDIDLGTNPALVGIDDLNVDVPAYWSTMWAAYFLRDKHLRLVQESYFDRADPVPGWTLVLRGGPPWPGVLEVRPVNETYELVRT